MSAHEQLRRYLEQRRDMGESELVLDQLTVEDVMGIIGAKSAKSGDEGSRRDSQRPGSVRESAAERRESRGDDTPDRPRVPSERDRSGATPSGNWREVLSSVPGGEASKQPGPAASTPGPEPKSGESHATVPLDQVPTGLVVGSSDRELFAKHEVYASLTDLADAVRVCRLCSLGALAKNPVPGEGNPDADFVVVGEAPGASEDEQGQPFVGRSGQLLTKILAAIQLSRDDVFICNVLKHRPPGNRNPTPEEVKVCSPFLLRQLDLLKPKVILAVGTFAAQTLLQSKDAIGKLRGKIHRYHGIPLIVTYHPAALLRNPSWKRPTWEDVQLARRILDHALGR